MNIYCQNKKIDEDGTIIYKKENILLEDYNVIEENNLIKLKPKKKIIIVDNIDKLKGLNFNNSTILDCFINGKKPTKNKYHSIMLDIYNLIGDGDLIIQNKLLNVKTENVSGKGYVYDEELGISIQRADANKTFKEIVNQCLMNNIKLNIEIKLDNDKLIVFTI